MKLKDVAKQYGLDSGAFGTWIKTSGAKYKSGAMGGIDIDDGQDIAGLVASFQSHQTAEKQRVADEIASKELAVQQKAQALGSMLITSGFGFEGHTITKYSGYISGDDVIRIPREKVNTLTDGLVQIRRNAIAELKEAAWALGCNAVIGVDFDYLTLEPETAAVLTSQAKYHPYLICVTANGNAVVIEKNSRTGLT
jgi:uncharacterized protein YbjQ (UPF0145 family)